ncbi:universal stress protein [Streptomyces sp. NPDC089424]|uniref:universal stress protein n=1 Tax=Streptomyces sp. NPDC089424 TaxID=3365917 RepID=UPI0038265CFF
MPGTVTVGLDGSPESRAAAEWAAREAKLRELSVKLVHVREPVPEPMAQAPLLGTETHWNWTEQIPRETAEGLRLRHPGVQVSSEHLSGRPSDVLVQAARDTELLALGSRALSGLGGFLVGSVGQAVVALAEVPVVLVRAWEAAADEHVMDPAGVPSAATSFRPVVLGLDTDSPDDTLIAFAIEEAARRDTALRVIQAWDLPPYYVHTPVVDVKTLDEAARRKAAELAEVLRPWRGKYPGVEVVENSRAGSPAHYIIDASRTASLVVVGRRIRRSPFGAHIGPVTHAVLHHAGTPVAVVAHS